MWYSREIKSGPCAAVEELPGESTEVLEDQDTEPMDPLVDLVEQLGREETPRSCADTAKHFRFGFGICICIISFPMAITGLLDAI